MTICVACHYSCQECTGASNSNCSSCPTSSSRIASPVAGVCSCVDNFYDNNAKICADCHYSCKTCSGPNENQCLSCPTSSYRISTPNASNQCTCINNYSDINNAVLCVGNCHYSCDTCTGLASNQCVTCPASSNRVSSPVTG